MAMGTETLCVSRSWLLYLEPGFMGPGVVLEEGETVLTHQPGQHTPQDKPNAITIGSIRRLVKVRIIKHQQTLELLVRIAPTLFWRLRDCLKKKVASCFISKVVLIPVGTLDRIRSPDCFLTLPHTLGVVLQYN